MKKEAIKAPDNKVLTARVINMDNFRSFMGYMPNPDEVLTEAGEAISVYRNMKTDPRIKSLLSVVKAAALSYPVRIQQGNSRPAVFADVIERIKPEMVSSLAKRLVAGIEFGYSVVEVIWDIQDSIYTPGDFVSRKPERFRFSADGRLKWVKQGEIVDLYDMPYKWLAYRHDKDAENPYGNSVLKACYWAWKFKKAGLQFWLMATEKFAVPSLLALFESSDSEDKIKEKAEAIAGMLESVGSGSGAALANIKDIKALEVDGKLGEFKVLMDWCDTQIAYAIVYQALAVQEAANGTRAQAEVHEDVFYETAKGICRDLQETLQKIVDWYVILNYGADEPAPSVSYDLENYASWAMVVEAIDRGVPVSKEAFYSRYGLPKPKDNEDSYVKPEGNAPLSLADADPQKKKRRPLPLILSKKTK